MGTGIIHSRFTSHRTGNAINVSTAFSKRSASSIRRRRTQNVSIDSATSRLASSLSRSSYSTSTQTLVTSRHVNRLVDYDDKKIMKLSSTYLPNHADTLRTKRGICYDFASLNAALLRAQGIPTRLVMGTAKGVDGYHAWNEVFVNGKWRVIDVTRDVTERRTTTYRSASDYRATLYD